MTKVKRFTVKNYVKIAIANKIIQWLTKANSLASLAKWLNLRLRACFEQRYP